MLILGLMDLLGLGGLSFGTGDRILLYVGGLFLCVLGYIMARRLPRGGIGASSGFPQSDLSSEPPPTDDNV